MTKKSSTYGSTRMPRDRGSPRCPRRSRIERPLAVPRRNCPTVAAVGERSCCTMTRITFVKMSGLADQPKGIAAHWM